MGDLTFDSPGRQTKNSIAGGPSSSHAEESRRIVLLFSKDTFKYPLTLPRNNGVAP
jgi:hypothetical protein